MIRKEEKKKISLSPSVLLTLLAGVLALGIFIGAGMNLFTPFTPLPQSKAEEVPQTREGTFKFLRSSIESGKSEKGRLLRELKPFKYKVSALINDVEKNNDGLTVSVYFRDLNNGNSFGIGELEKFSPLSLLRVPLMIAYFKWAETNPLVLRKRLTYPLEAPATQNQPAPAPQTTGLARGKSYSVNDLIYKMIARDDDEAYKLLSANLPPGRLDKTFKDLYVDYDPAKQDDSVSLSAFAAFYRVLFNASYLSEEMSEKALRYLSRSSFRTGMASGVPPNIEIVSKHGERTFDPADGNNNTPLSQLHEVGIIYHPNQPFLLGIMVRGKSIEQETKVIRDITRLIYDEVDKQS